MNNKDQFVEIVLEKSCTVFCSVICLNVDFDIGCTVIFVYNENIALFVYIVWE